MQLRMGINCSVSITDRIEESGSRRLLSPFGAGEVKGASNAQEVIERYRRLLQAVLGNWWYTEWMVRVYLSQRIETASEITLYDVGLERENEREMIALILGRLDEDDANFFRQVCDQRWLLIQDDPFWDCIELELSSPPEFYDRTD
jgi:hypothetical protein